MTRPASAQLGKFLSWVLRHDPGAIGLTLEPGGWVGIASLLEALGKHERSPHAPSRAELERCVAEDDKARFTISDDGRRIRAAQGHSIPVELELEARAPPERLYHGTAKRSLAAILAQGLLRRRRHHVHLSADPDTASRVGGRRGRPVVLEIDAAAMARDGFAFWRSDNGVWLCERVPPAYLRALATGELSSHEWPVSATELELTLPGDQRICARAWGPAGDQPVLAMHGWLDNAASFDALAPLLCQRLDLRVVSLDLPGHGRSGPKPGHYHFIDWVADALGAADALGWQRFSLLGHSMGAGISTLVAGAAPERVERATLIEGLGPMSEAPEQAAKRLARSLRVEARKRDKPKRRHPSIEAAATRLREAAAMQHSSALTLVERGLEPDADGFVWRADPRLRIDSRLRLSEAQIHAFLRAIRCPVLLIRAREGWPIDAALRRARMDCVAELSLVELPGRHHLHLDAPEPVAEAIVEFWAATDPA